MNEYFQQLLDRFRELWGRLTPLQKALVTGVPLVAFAVIVLILAALTKPAETYGVLFSNLAREDASVIVGKLKSAGLPYRLQDDGTTVEIPIEQVMEWRISLGGEGLPKGAGVGFELFDKTKVLGTTEAQQRVAYLRALQGELTRTVMSITEIRTARVNLAIPKDTLFSDQAKPTTASVVIEVKRGHSLEPGQIRGIVHLVAASVEGLKPQNVKVVDNHGNVLSDLVRDDLLEDGDGTLASLSRQAKLTREQMAVKKAVEVEMETRIKGVLGQVLGMGRSAVKVTADIDFDQVKTVSKTYEPSVGTDGVKRSSGKKDEQYEGIGGIPGGVPGVESNIPGYQAVVGGNLSYKRKEDIENYEVNEKIEEVLRAPGTIKRLAVAVFVDNVQAQQHAAIRRGVEVAAGVDVARGDVITVENLPFDKTLMDEMAAENAAVGRREREQMWLDIGKFGAIVVVALLALVFLRALVRPRVVRERVLVEVAGAPVMEEAPPPPPPPLPAEEVAPPPPVLVEQEPTAALERQRRQQIRQHVTRMARQRPEMVAQIIKRWLLEEKH